MGGRGGSNPGPAATACHLPVCTTGPLRCRHPGGPALRLEKQLLFFLGWHEISKPAYPGAAAGPGHVSQEPLPAGPPHVRSTAQALGNRAHRKLPSPRRALAITTPQSWAKTTPAQRKKRLLPESLPAAQEERRQHHSLRLAAPKHTGSRRHHQRLLTPTERPPEARPPEDTQPNKTRTGTKTSPRTTNLQGNTDGRQEQVI